MSDSLPLHLVSLSPDLAALAEFGQRNRRIIPAGGDLGYAVHAALAALFGAAAPKPFRLFGADGRKPPTLLAYAAQDGGALSEDAALQAAICPEHDLAARALGFSPESLIVKRMPASWSTGRRYRFETRIRPVIRTTRNDPRGAGRELDAYVAEVGNAAEPDRLDREQVYAAWLAKAITRSGGAHILPRGLAIMGLRRSRLYTGNGTVEGPDVQVAGLLEVTDGTAFAHLLARGIGRHRAFGYGMLLLRPAGAG